MPMSLILSPQFCVNITLNAVSLIVMLIIFFSGLSRRGGTRSERSFLWWNVNLIALYFGEVVIELSSMLLQSGSTSVLPFVLYRIGLLLDFFLYNLMALSFYRYIGALVMEAHPEKHRIGRFVDVTFRIFLIWNIVSSVLFAVSFFTEWFFTFENTVVVFKESYSVLLVIVMAGVLINPVFALSHYRELGIKKSLLLFSYFLFPVLLLILDYAYDLTLSYAMIMIITVVIYIEININQAHELALEKAKAAEREVELTNMRVNLMMAQIQPHFLYNALSSISYLCTTDPKEAEKATNEFSDYLRSNLHSINSQIPIPFEIELKHVENYLKIQHRRFRERMVVEYDVGTTDFRIPALALQTIVENAVHYGVEARFEPTTIRIITCEEVDGVSVIIKDNGPGFDTSVEPSRERLHLGIQNTRSRLSEMVGGTLQVESEIGIGTTVTMTIPMEKEEMNEDEDSGS